MAKGTYDPEGIYLCPNPDDISKFHGMVLGPADTPYQDGFHVFEITLGVDYPFNPPKLSYISGDGIHRLNPNLYTNGKVCLSVLGTWEGPPWTPAMTIAQVLLMIRSQVLVRTPLVNEPGHETAPVEKLCDHNHVVRYCNYRLGLLEPLKAPRYPEAFTKIIRSYFDRNRDAVMERLQVLASELDGQKITAEQNPETTLDYTGMIAEFAAM